MNNIEEKIRDIFNPIILGMNKSNALKELQEEYGKLEIEAIREMLMPYVAKIYNIPLSSSKAPRNYGAMSLEINHANYEVARKMLYRLSKKVKIN